MPGLARIATALAASALLVCTALPATAITTDLEIVGESEGLVVVPAGKNLFDLTNMNPGDSRQALIELRNDYTKCYDIWLRAEDVAMDKPGLFEVMEMTVRYRGKPLYEGPVTGFAGGEGIYLGCFQPGESGVLAVAVELPGLKTGNEYQGESASVKWLFTARADEESAAKTRKSPGEPVQRRLPQTLGKTAPYLFVLLGTLLLTGGLMARRRKGC